MEPKNHEPLTAAELEAFEDELFARAMEIARQVAGQDRKVTDGTAECEKLRSAEPTGKATLVG